MRADLGARANGSSPRGREDLLSALYPTRFIVVSASEVSSGRGDEQTIVADREGVITHWGSVGATTFGYSAEEAVGRSVALIIPPVLQARHWRGFNNAVRTGRLKRDGATLKVPAIHKSGAVLAVEGRLTLDRADDGAVDGVTLKLLGEGPRWSPAFWRAVLALLRAGQTIVERVRPRASNR